MIPRYSRAPMTDIWSSKSRFKIWLDIELYACEAMEKLGTVPKGTSKKVKSKAKINEKRIDAIEKKVKHDVIAFLTSVNEFVGDSGRYIHVGMTSSDVLDTGLSLQLKDSCELLLEEIENLENKVRLLALSLIHISEPTRPY